MFTEWSFLDRFSAAADAGFRAVEFLFPYEYMPDAVANAVSGNGLEVVFFNLPAGNWAAGDRGLAALPDRRSEFRRGLRDVIPYVEATGTRKLHMMSGCAPFLSRKARDAYESALHEALECFEPLDLTLLIEPINQRDMPGYFLSDYEFACKAILGAGDRVKMTYDFYHRQVIAGDLLPAFHRLLPVIGHIQVASAPGRHEPGCEELNSQYIFQEIDQSGYAGHVGCEYRPRNGTLAGLDWIEPYLISHDVPFSRRNFGRRSTASVPLMPPTAARQTAAISAASHLTLQARSENN